MRRRTRHWLLGGTLALAAVGGLSWQLLRETQTAAIANAPGRAQPFAAAPAIQHCLAGAGAAGAAGSRGERRGAAAALAGG